MKKCFAVLIAALLILFAGCSMLGMRGSKAKAVTGKVTIGFTLTRISGRGSNQYASWIEDETGRYVRTLFVTDYMTRRQGWKVRQQSLVNWVKAADLNNKQQADIDALSSATPQAGKLSVVWDLKDATGKAVVAGVYVYLIEGCLLNENHVLWTGKIRVGGAKETSQATSIHFPEGADKLGRTLILDVSAVYDPTP
jgi:hypothetical protein